MRREANLPELGEFCGGHSLQGFTGEAHVVSHRDGQVCIGAVAILHCERSLLLLQLLLCLQCRSGHLGK